MIQELIDNISENRIQNFIRSKNSAFKEVTEDYSYKLTDDRFSDLKKLGYIDHADSDSLLVFSCKYNDDLSSRSSKKIQFEIAKNLLKEDFKDGAVFVFYDNAGRFRFSFIRKNYGDKEQKFTPWRRYTYYVDKRNQTNKTFKDCIGNASFTSLEKIQEGFSLEPLSDEFFYRYKEIYGKFVGYITGKYYKKKNSKWEEVDYADHEPDFIQFKKEFNSNHKQVRDYVKKLLGRLVFLKFIEKKGWLGVIEETKEIEPNFLENVFKNSSYQDDFLDKVLEEVIFESLNNPIGNTNKCEELKKYSFPYLNGGLFEKDELDNKSIRFPEEYFQEIFEFFNQYNFTIDENDPNDAEVSVDPEMLGHIFENLLEDNKDKGAFYTPKEIVHYMCQESLIEYLCTSLNFDTDNEKDLITELVKTKEIDKDLKDSLIEVEKALDKVKICDPAIGSGAFPMGLLQEIFSIKQSIYYNIHNTLDNFPAAEKKLNIIQNNIYGVDIEQGAVDIARLRFWLSLVVDETEAKPLPNLDYKIMCGNSLISRYPLDMPLKNVFDQYNKGKKPEEKLSLRKYKDLVNSYTDTHLGKDVFKAMIEQIKATFKQSLSDKELSNIKSLKGKIKNTETTLHLFEVAQNQKEKEDLKKQKQTLLKLEQKQKEIEENKIYENSFEWRFEFPDLLDEEGNFQGFNIVIGNPPYGVSIKDDYRKVVESSLGKVPDYEIYYYFIQIAYKLLTKNGVKAFIIPNTYLFNTFAAAFRLSILDNWEIIEILDCTKFKIFDSATVYNTINTWKKSKGTNIGYRNTKQIKSFIELISKERSIISKDNLISMNQNWGLAFNLDNEVINIVKKIKSKSINLKILFPEISQGLIAYDKYQGQSENIIKNRIFHHFEFKDGLKKWLWGEDINRYKLSWNNREYIDYCDGIANPRDPKYFKGKRILIREITNPRIFATITDVEYYNDPSVIIIKDNNENSILQALGILNSKLATFFHFNYAPKATKGAFPKILIKDIQEFPLPLLNEEIRNEIEKRVELLLNEDDIDKSLIENEIDRLVYQLYDLNDEEIAIVEGRV